MVAGGGVAVKDDQRAAGKLVDVVIVLAITFLLYSQRLNEVVGAVLLGAIVQARGAVGVTGRLAGLLGVSSSSGSSGSGGPPSDPMGGGGSGLGGVGGVNRPTSTSDTIQRLATTGSALGWAGASWIDLAGRGRGSRRAGYAVLGALLLGCVAWRASR